MTADYELPTPKLPLRREAASAYLKDRWGLSYTPRTLAKIATTGGSPPMEYAGRFRLYPQDGVDDWAAAKFAPRVSSTAERHAQQSAEPSAELAGFSVEGQE